VTSFGETDVGDKFHSVDLRRAYLPIHPAKNRDTKIQLRLQNGVELRKKSYANTREQRTIPWGCLRPYDRNDSITRYVLTRDSYQKLARYAEYVPDTTALYHAPPIVVPATPARTLTQAERLPSHRYDTFPASSAPSPALQEYRYPTPPPARPHQRTDPLLPRYHVRPGAYNTGVSVSSNREFGSGSWGACFTILVLAAVLLGLVVWLLWATWPKSGDGLSHAGTLSSVGFPKFQWPGLRDLAVGARDFGVFVVRVAVW
jgi:hypothetical protein